jgi:hypothetical protein
MKVFILHLCVAALFFLPNRARSQDLNWGSPINSEIVDSNGAPLDQSFIFQIGAFVGGFIPDGTNTSNWLNYWQVFDAADYNGVESPDDGIVGYFTSTAAMTDSGLSDSSDLSPLASSFEGLDAYLWIRNSNLPIEGSEWFLARAGDWVFPVAVPGCCDNQGLVEWSTSDFLVDDVPVWGSQGGTQGDGFYTTTGSDTIQTFTFVPEPSTAMLVAFLSGAMLMRRRRSE